MIDETPFLKSYHDLYCQLTGLEVPLSFDRMMAWRIFTAQFNQNDLRLVIRHLQEKIRRKEKKPSCLTFRWFIGNTEFFAEDLAEARSLSRRPVRDARREEVLRATGRTLGEEPKENVRTPADILAGDEAFKKFLQLRDGL